MDSKYNAIRDIIVRNTHNDGKMLHISTGIRVIQRNAPTEFSRCLYTPACILVIQGAKHVLYGKRHLTYSKGQYVLSCADIPALSRVVEATPEKPFIVLVLEFDYTLITSLLLEINSTSYIDTTEIPLAIAEADANLLDAFYRLVQCIEKPHDSVLSSMIIKEIYYWILIGPLGNQLQTIHTKGTRFHQIAQAMVYIKENYNKKLCIDSIANYVNMASSSFYRNFRRIVQISPLQYQKQLRLHEAQRLMLTGKYTVESVSYHVGYESPTQFSREYKKMFGNSPKTDIVRLIC